MVLKRKRLTERFHGKPVHRSIVERVRAAEPGEKIEWSPEGHVLQNLCMLSPDSRNGRTYTPEAMARLKELYEGARAYQDHPNDPSAPRSTKDRIGRWHNVQIKGGKLRGDLHYDPNHPYSRSLIWAAQECPEHCGVSHNIEAEGYEDEDGHFTVTRPTEVRSVDVVDDPATNKSLLESRKPKRRKAKEGAMDPELEDDELGMDGEGETPEHHLGAYISACCDDPNMDKASKRKKILKALDLYDEPESEEEEFESDEDGEDVDTKDPEDKRGKPDPQEPEGEDQFEEEWDDVDDGAKKEDGPMVARESLERLRRHKDRKIRAVAEIALRALPKPLQVRRVKPLRQAAPESVTQHPAFKAMAKRLDALESRDINAKMIQTVIAECKRYGLPKRGISKVFVEDLADCPDPKRRKRAIQERAQAMSITLPRSFGPGGANGGPPPMTNQEFAAMVDGVE